MAKKDKPDPEMDNESKDSTASTDATTDEVKNDLFVHKTKGTRTGFLGAKTLREGDEKRWETEDETRARVEVTYDMSADNAWDSDREPPGFKVTREKPKRKRPSPAARRRRRKAAEAEAKGGEEQTEEVVVDGVDVIEAKTEEGQTLGEALDETQADHPDATVLVEDPDEPPIAEKPEKAEAADGGKDESEDPKAEKKKKATQPPSDQEN